MTIGGVPGRHPDNYGNFGRAPWSVARWFARGPEKANCRRIDLVHHFGSNVLSLTGFGWQSR
ncbi:hypothetical protein AB4Y89_08080 [Terriglobus sp. 2YAB30_2]|uniref:hypothetical protein n=1 Tax=unclassified Terriglobus TaxID=2628988 RepID=UPI003F9E8E47